MEHKSLPKTLEEGIIYEYRENNRPIGEIIDWLKHRNKEWIDKDLGDGWHLLIDLEAVIGEQGGSVIVFDSNNDVFYINKRTLTIHDLEEYPVYDKYGYLM